MHELGITQEILAIACEVSEGRPIQKIEVEVGKLAAVLPDAVQFCFEVCREGTPAERAVLSIIEVPGKARCRKCSTELTLEVPFGYCSCGESDLDWLSGDELRVKTITFAGGGI